MSADQAEKPPVVNKEMVLVMRLERAWSQRELGRRAGIQQGTVSKVERGEMVAGCMPTVEKLAKAFGVKPEELNKAPDPRVLARLVGSYNSTPVGTGSPLRARTRAENTRARGRNSETAQAALQATVNVVRPTTILPPENDSSPPRPRRSYRPRVADNPLIAAILKVAVAEHPWFAWDDIHAAVKAAKESGAYLTPTTDLPSIARTLLDSARINRLKVEDEPVSPMAVLATAVYSKAAGPTLVR